MNFCFNFRKIWQTNSSNTKKHHDILQFDSTKEMDTSSKNIPLKENEGDWKLDSTSPEIWKSVSLGLSLTRALKILHGVIGKNPKHSKTE